MIAGLLALVALAGVLTGLWQRSRIRELKARLDVTSIELQSVQQSCALLAPAGVVQRVVSEGLNEVAENKVITVMFTDLVGYTTMSEQLEPRRMAEILNCYFQCVSDAVTENRGRIGTYLGDGILSYFGAIEPNPWQCNDAVAAALALRDAIERLGQDLETRGLPRIAVGMGIHRGPGLAGLIGSRDRREFAVVGRTVNLAARVQALTRVHETDILLTPSVREQLDPRFQLEEMPATLVKGIADPVVTYALRGPAEKVFG